jgi:hypothetical protein
MKICIWLIINTKDEVSEMLQKLLLYLPDWDIWAGAFVAFIVPYGISRIIKWLSG